jgi:hypothetical protein
MFLWFAVFFFLSLFAWFCWKEKMVVVHEKIVIRRKRSDVFKYLSEQDSISDQPEGSLQPLIKQSRVIDIRRDREGRSCQVLSESIEVDIS